MNIGIIAFILVYLSILFCYFFSETSGNLKRRSINKITLASMFLIFGIVAYIVNYNFFSYHLLSLIAIIFAFLGDVYLLYSFTKGGILFLISNALFFIYEWAIVFYNEIPLSNILWFILLFISLFGSFFVLTMKKILNFKTKNPQILTYVGSVTLQGTLGITIALYYLNIKMILLGLGLGLFMISDYFLMVHKFKVHKNWILRSNSACYFIGLLMVVLSFMY